MKLNPHIFIKNEITGFRVGVDGHGYTFVSRVVALNNVSCNLPDSTRSHQASILVDYELDQASDYEESD